MASIGDALPKGSGGGGPAILGPDQPFVFGYELTRALVVGVLALVGKPVLESGRQMSPVATLRLGKAMGCLPQLMRMRNLLARGERQQVVETRIYADGPSASARDSLRLSVDAQAEIPARHALDDASIFD